ncbi:MAG: hypothetical protein H7833_11240 [Magnetococcus sp. DMHC-1]|nr:hypothetical protein [Magnetococcales bacterium]
MDSEQNKPENSNQLPPFPFPGVFPPPGFPGFDVEGFGDKKESKLDLSDLMWGLLKYSWVTIIITVIFTYNAYQKAKNTPYLYKAMTSLISADESGGTMTQMAATSVGTSNVTSAGFVSGLLGPLSGLLMGGGISGPGGDLANVNLKSRTFMTSLIREENLLPELYPDQWDEVAGKWKNGKEPDLFQAAQKLRLMIQLGPDAVTGTYSLSVTTEDPVKAAKWANLLVDVLNRRLRAKAIKECEEKMEFLTNQIKQTSYVEFQQAIAGLMEVEIKKMMAARLRKEFIYRVIDPAIPPRIGDHVSPDKGRMVTTGLGIGFMIGFAAAVVLHFLETLIRKRLRQRREMKEAKMQAEKQTNGEEMTDAGKIEEKEKIGEGRKTEPAMV